MATNEHGGELPLVIIQTSSRRNLSLQIGSLRKRVANTFFFFYSTMTLHFLLLLERRRRLVCFWKRTGLVVGFDLAFLSTMRWRWLTPTPPTFRHLPSSDWLLIRLQLEIKHESSLPFFCFYFTDSTCWKLVQYSHYFHFCFADSMPNPGWFLRWPEFVWRIRFLRMLASGSDVTNQCRFPYLFFASFRGKRSRRSGLILLSSHFFELTFTLLVV